MPRFIDYSYDQIKLLPIDFHRQILPGTFEYTLNYLIDHEVDMDLFHQRYCNDEEGRPAYDPAILLKIVLLAYSRGVTSSRKIERLCRENILFMAISADSQPHYTTLAEFISHSSEAITALFTQVLLICDAEGLIGKELFAVDGCKLPSNAGKEWSGTHEELKKKREKIERAIRYLIGQHQNADRSHPFAETEEQRIEKQLQTLKSASQKIKAFLVATQDRKGVSGRIVKSNLTDNDSAKIKTSHGVIQGYTAVATVDHQRQIIVQAQTYGQGQEHGLLEPSIEQAHHNLGHSHRQWKSTKILSDSGYHNQNALTWLENNEIDGYIADVGFRSRDPKFKDYEKHKPKDRLKAKTKFTKDDFQIDQQNQTCLCPAGKPMWLKNEKGKIGHHLFLQFQAYEKDCPVCPLKAKCLRNSQQKTPRQLNIKQDITEERKSGVIERMKQKLDSPQGRALYSKRLGTVEPVFANIRIHKGLDRFTLRGKTKVNDQWRLYCLIHNIEKLQRYGKKRRLPEEG